MARRDKIIAAASSVNDEILNRSIRHALFMERLKTGQVKSITSFLDRNLLPDLVDLLEIRLRRVATRGVDRSVLSTQRLRDMIGSADKLLTTGLRDSRLQLTKNLTDIVLSEAEFQVAILRQSIPLELDFVTPNVQLLKSIVTTRPIQGRLLKDMFSDVEKLAKSDLRAGLNVGLAAGESVPQIMRRVRGTVSAAFQDGVTGKLRRRTEAIVRTSVNHVVNHSKDAVYSENDDVIKKWKFVATLDARTTDICASRDGRVYNLGEGERPPLHINCRSTTTPIVKSWKELGIDLDEAPVGTRASMNGQVPADLTYGNWLRKQPISVQEEALGKGRAKLFRERKLSIDRFVDSKGKSLSLSQIREREGL